MRKDKWYILLLAVLLAACTNVPEVSVATHTCAVHPAGGRASACACTLNGKAYVFGGRDTVGNYRNDLWQYDPATDSWTNLGNAPMKKRVNATMVSDGGKLYVGLGYAAKHAYNDSSYLRDWWSYTPSTGEWQALDSFPTRNTVAVCSFAQNNYIYAVYGFGWGWTRDIWRYSIANNSWEMLPDNRNRAEAVGGGCGALLNGIYYFGTGYRTLSERQWFAADITSDTWTRCASIPGKGREVSACAASNDFVYLFGGRYFGGDMTGGEIFNTYMRYSPDKDSWEWCGTMPCGRAENQIAFTINGKVYFGLGEDENGHVYNSLYRIDE